MNPLPPRARYTFGVKPLLLLVVLVGVALAQRNSNDIQGPPSKKLNVWIERPNYTYKADYHRLETIDWQNLSYPWGVGEGWFHLKNGKYQHSDTPAGIADEEVTFTKVYFLGDPAEYAVVLLNEMDCGANCTWYPTTFVFHLSNQRLTLSQVISPEVHGTPDKTSFDPKTRRLTVYATNYGYGSHCCPQYIDIVTYRWSGAEFVRISRKIIPNPN